jgi:hypothetical protein
MSAHLKKLCAYCGLRPGTTRDHVPPKCLFAPSMRANLITIPACNECHSEYKLDDEYFRTILAIRNGLPNTESVKHIQESTRRAFANPMSSGLRASILKDIVPVTPTDTAAFGLRIEARRIKSTTHRIVAGLSSHILKTPIPATHEVTAFPIDLQTGVEAIEHPVVRECVQDVLDTGKTISIGDVLDARYAKPVDDQLSILWLIELHGVFRAFGYLTPRSC